MPSRVKIKKKKSLVLTPKHVEAVSTPEPASEPAPAPRKKKKKVVIQSGKSRLKGTDRKSLGAHSGKLPTLRVEDEDLHEVKDAPELDASDSMVVELNSSTVKDTVLQVPLEPSRAEPSPPSQKPGEESFKFFCYRCGQRLKVPVAWANKSIPCGRCGHDLVIPPPLVDPA